MTTACFSSFPPLPRLTAAACGAALVAACHGGGGGVHSQVNTLPGFISGGVRTTAYDGVTDDLLTAGLGKSGLASAVPPGFANPSSPTAAELRRLAIYSNYRALVGWRRRMPAMRVRLACARYGRGEMRGCRRVSRRFA
jgi:hypothetical protein